MDYDKLSANLAAAVESMATPLLPPAGVAGFNVVGGPNLQFAPLSDATVRAGSPSLRVFLRCPEEKTFQASPDFQVFQQTGHIRTAEATVKGIEALSLEPDVERIAAAVTLRPAMDVAASLVGVPAFRLNNNLSGAGVVVGIVDSGIDATHPAFGVRIDSIWDQTIAGTGWGSTNYGTVLQGANLSISSDLDGHGTHVAGIAAADDVTYGGIAPGATIVAVKSDFRSTSIADGIRYVFWRADELGLPAVVNLSLGGHADAHDGSDDLSALVDQLCGPGRIVVAAAGNEGNDPIHAQAVVAAHSTTAIPFHVVPASSAGAAAWVVLNCWYDGGQPCEVQVQTSTGAATAWQPVISGSSPTRTYPLLGGTVRITTSPGSSNPNGDHQVWVEIVPPAGAKAVPGGAWQLLMRNPGASDVTVHAWSIAPSGAADAAFDASVRRQSHLIGSPGAAVNSITAAAYTSRNTWTDSSGTSRTVGLVQNQISDFSSPGPLRNGHPKPDVTAPGAMIVSCLSGSSSPRPPYVINSQFLVMSGTSMACPFTAGVIALLLQQNPYLDHNAIRAALRATSRGPGPGFDPKWGYGLIDL